MLKLLYHENTMQRTLWFLALAGALVLIIPAGHSQPTQDDVPFERTEAMVEMRDGVKLFTLLFVPKNAKGPLPMILIRTPYGIDGRAENNFKSYLKDMVDEGYAFAFQDIRGRYKSEGKFVMTRPARDPNDPKAIDEEVTNGDDDFAEGLEDDSDDDGEE